MSNIFKTFFGSVSRKNIPSNTARRSSRRTAFEQLEDRQLLAVTAGLGGVLPVEQAAQTAYEASADEDLAIDLAELVNADHVVTTTEDVLDPDDGVLSLREAIAAAQDGESIVFSEALGDSVVVNVSSELVVANAITIDGGGRVALDGGTQTHILTVTGGAETQRVQLKGLTFQNASSVDGGALYAADSAYLALEGSVFRNNAAQVRGGAIYSETSQLTISNCVFYANTASKGGALYDEYGGVALYNCTIAGNSAKGGGGVYTPDQGGVVYNSIVTNNFAFDRENIFGETYQGSNNWVDKDVMFVEPPRFNADGTLKNLQTLDLRLLGSSAAVDAGDSALAQSAVDALGNTRAAGSAVDIGAYEYQGSDLAYEVNVSGKVRINTTLTASATGQNADNVRYYWYVSDTPDGELSLIEGADQKTYKAPNEYLGKYLTVAAAADTYAATTVIGPLEKAKLCKRVIESDATSDKIVISWIEVPHAGSYRVQYRAAGTEEWTTVEIDRPALELTGLTPDTSYDFRVKAISEDNQTYYLNGDYSGLTVKTLKADDVSDSDPVAPAKGVSVDSRLPESAELSWLGSDAADGYNVYVYNADRTQLLKTVSTETSSIVLEGLTPSTTYSVDIVASSETLGVSEPETIQFKTLGKKLVIPSVSASFAADTALIQWDAVPNAQGYLVTYKGEGEPGYKTLGTVDGTTCTIDGLDPDTVYRVRVKAIGDGGVFLNSDNGAAYALSPELDLNTVYAPKTIVLENVRAVTAALSWSEGYNADSYRVVVKDVNGEILQELDTDQTSLKISGLTEKTTYNVEVYSVSTTLGESKGCAALTLSTGVVKKLAKPVVTAEAFSDGSIKISWEGIDGATSYRVQLRRHQPNLNGNNPWKTYESVEATSATIYGLKPGWTYDIRVRANGDDADYYNSDNARIVIRVPK